MNINPRLHESAPFTNYAKCDEHKKFKMYAVAHLSRVGVCFYFVSSALEWLVYLLFCSHHTTHCKLHMSHVGGDQVLCMEWCHCVETFCSSVTCKEYSCDGCKIVYIVHDKEMIWVMCQWGFTSMKWWVQYWQFCPLPACKYIHWFQTCLFLRGDWFYICWVMVLSFCMFTHCSSNAWSLIRSTSMIDAKMYSWWQWNNVKACGLCIEVS